MLRAADRTLRALRRVLPVEDEAIELPWTPEFLHKQGGLVLSMGQLMQWMSAQVLASGAVQLWPGTPVARALVEGGKVHGVRLLDQGVDRQGRPEAGFMPGMDVHAALTVVGDGPVGAVGRQLDAELGMPAGHARREWAVGMKFVVDLPEDTALEPGTVLHTIGFPEPEIFGFLYVHPERVASVGIFVPSWFESPARTSYRYLQHYVQHPALWRHLNGARLRSWGAKSLLESGRRGEPVLAGDGFARIGEGSGSTNVLTSSGVDEAFTTGVQLAEGVIELLEAGRPLSREGLEAAYVARRRASWIEAEARVAERARDGFQRGVVPGLLGMALAGLTRGKVALGHEPPHPADAVGTLEGFYAGRIPAEELARIRAECAAKGAPLHDALMDRAGWPAVPLDGKLLVSQQDALLMGGKVQAPPGYADHVTFRSSETCRACGRRVCVEICSAEALAAGRRRRPELRSREVRPLRRVPVELHRARGRVGRGEPGAPRRDGRPALRGELAQPLPRAPWPRSNEEHMSAGYQIVVLGSIVPDPLQTLEPAQTPQGPGLKNELMLPHVLDPWAAHALYEAANLAARTPGSRCDARLARPEGEAATGHDGGRPEGALRAGRARRARGRVHRCARGRGARSQRRCGRCPASIAPGCYCSAAGSPPRAARASRSSSSASGSTSPISSRAWISSRPGRTARFEVLERVEGGKHQVSACAGAPAVLGWATGSLPEPTNNPQVGMANMRSIMPALQKAAAAPVGTGGVEFVSVAVPRSQRETRIVKDMSPDDVAREIVEWIGQD